MVDANASTPPAASVLLASLSWAASPYSAIPKTSLTGCPGSWQQRWLNLPNLEKTRIDLEKGDSDEAVHLQSGRLRISGGPLQ